MLVNIMIKLRGILAPIAGSRLVFIIFLSNPLSSN